MFPAYWQKFIELNRLVDVSAHIEECDDLSGIGVDLEFLTQAQSEDELTDCWPGIGVARDGYIPVASCLIGTGDYYYINHHDGSDGPLYRIYHDEVGVDGYDPKTAIVKVLERYVWVLDFVKR